MEKKEIRIFKSDLEVPDIVSKKADAAFARIKEERAKGMKKEERNQRFKKEQGKVKKYVRPVIAAAACAAIFAGVGICSRTGRGQEGPLPEAESVQKEGTAAAETVQAQGNWFSMTAYAKELEPGKAVPLADMGDSGRAFVLCGNEAGGISYCIGTDFLCRGENIDYFSYSINSGAFQVVQPVNPEDRIVLDGQVYDGEMNTGSIGGGFEEAAEEQPELYETALYRSFTLDYEKQSAENTWINICNEYPGQTEIEELIWGEGRTLEEESEGINRMLDGTVITCTAHYTDGTSQSVDIEVGCRVMTYEEAGEPGGEGEIPGDTEEVFIVFEVK